MQFKPTEYNLDMKNPDSWKELAYALPDDVLQLIPNANLSEEHLMEGAGAIGNIYDPAKAGYDVYFMHKEHTGIARVTNEKDENGKFVGLFPESVLGWHNNGNWRHWRHVVESALAFYCVKPGEGVITSFCNSKAAYDDLPMELKMVAENFEYWAEFDKNNSIYQFDDESLNAGMDEMLAIFEGTLKATGRKNKVANPVRGSWKPLIVEHPGRTVPAWFKDKGKAIYTGHFGVMRRCRSKETGEEFTMDEMKPLLKLLHDHLFQEKYIYHHEWKQGDLLLNDQFFSYHARNEVKGDRLMYRVAFNYKNLD